MDQAIHNFKYHLKEANQSITQARLVVFKVLFIYGPLSTSGLIQQVAVVDSNINRSSIYRALHLFEALGVTHRIINGWKYKIELSDNFKPHHHHLICTKCNKIFDFRESDTLIDELNKIAHAYQFNQVNHSLEFRGICADCWHKK